MVSYYSFSYYMHTAGSHYCCTAQDSVNGDQLTAQFGADLKKQAKGRNYVQEK